MPPRLIVNADDFGLTPGINRAIAALHDAGAVTSATLMANGPAFEDAVALARARPTLGVGCHVVLTDGTPVCSPRTIPSLMARDGHSFRPSLGSFLAALLTYHIDPGDIEREAVAQIRRLQQAGVPVTHLDTHKHTHAFPAVTRALLAAARAHRDRLDPQPFRDPSELRTTRAIWRGCNECFRDSQATCGDIRTSARQTLPSAFFDQPLPETFFHKPT